MIRKRPIRLRDAPLRARLEAARRAGEALPSVEVGGYRVALGSADNRLYVTRADEARGRVYLGRVDSSGFRPRREVVKGDIEVIRALVEQPLETAARAATLAVEMGIPVRCLCCGHPLGDRSKLKGIGPGCFESWGWEKWPNE